MTDAPLPAMYSIFAEVRSSGSHGSNEQLRYKLKLTMSTQLCITDVIKEVIYLSNTFEELGIQTGLNVTVHNVNASALKLIENPVYHARIKHIAIRHHFLREILQEICS